MSERKLPSAAPWWSPSLYTNLKKTLIFREDVFHAGNYFPEEKGGKGLVFEVKDIISLSLISISKINSISLF